jgi:hypothetical protein
MNVKPVRRRTFLARVSGLGAIGVLGQGLSTSVALAAKPSKPSPVFPLANVTAADFAPFVGSVFQVNLGKSGSTAIMLVEAQEIHHKTPPNGRPAPRQAFSLLFQGPGSIRFPQNTYRLQHPMIGAFDLFLVPIGARGQMTRYEAIFG